MRANIIKKRKMSLAFEKTAHMNLGCKLFPVHYRYTENPKVVSLRRGYVNMNLSEILGSFKRD